MVDTHSTGCTMSSGLYDLMTVAASRVQNTWDRSAPWRKKRASRVPIQALRWKVPMTIELYCHYTVVVLFTTFNAAIAAK